MSLLRDIHSVSVAPFGPDLPFRGLAELDHEETVLSQGGFGAVHRLRTVDGRSVAGVLVKVMFDAAHGEHAHETIKLLHEKLKKRFGDGLTAEYPELLGLPFMVFCATNEDGKKVVGMAMLDLKELGFADIGSDDWDPGTYLRQVDPIKKLHMAYQLARVADLFDELDFIHADLKDRSVFVHAERPQIALIDFDSGFHPDRQGAATTIGALTQWASAMLHRWIKSKQGASDLTVEERRDEERWALASGIFELLTGVAPYFFLRDGDEGSIAAYLRDHTWPEADPASPLINGTNLPFLNVAREWLSELESAGGGDLVAAFKRTFKRGYFKPGARPKAGAWKSILQSLCAQHVEAPAIASFTADKPKFHRQGEEVRLSWVAGGHRVLYLDGKPLSFGCDMLTVHPRDTSTYTLKAVSDFGTTEQACAVEAVKVDPVVRFFSASKALRDSIDPITLEWDVQHAMEVRIDPGSTVPAGGQATDVTPETTTEYTLRAFGYFGQLATAKVTVEVQGPVIAYFDWEVNLLEGIDNVDLKWRAEHAKEVTIDGVPGTHPAEGLVHVAIRTPTTFLLEAKGLFGSTSVSLKAFPFPVPVIEQIRMEYPDMEFNTQVTIPPVSFSFRDLDTALLGDTPPTSPLAPGYLRDEMEQAVRDLDHQRGHWLLSGRAIWERLTGNHTQKH